MKQKVTQFYFKKYNKKGSEIGLDFTFSDGECFELQLEAGNTAEEVAYRFKRMAEIIAEKLINRHIPPVAKE